MSSNRILYGMSYKGDLGKMRKTILIFSLVVGLSGSALASECGGKGYTGLTINTVSSATLIVLLFTL